ncbi:hypothetical protein vseg_002025 [Gypsophila vaccaria]
MSDDDKNSPKPSLHPVYTVHNIQHKIRVLDGTKVTYASWVKLFKLHARAYKVLHHIDGTAAPTKTDPGYNEWCEIDSHVLQWIYGTLSDDLLARVLDTDSTAHDAWTRVQNIFLNNKGARAASLEHEFTNLKLTSMSSLDEYCQRLRDLASQLTDVDAKVTDQRLVLQLVRGLPSSYDTVASYINQTLPSFETARSMLELEQHRQQSRDDAPTALAASSSTPAHSSPSWPEPAVTAPTSHHRSNAPPRRNNGRRGPPSRGRLNRHHHNMHPSPNNGGWDSPPPWVTQWAPPPCPYPTLPGWAGPWPSQPPWPSSSSSQSHPPSASSGRGQTRPSSAFSNHSRRGHAYTASETSYQPTDLGSALHAMSLDPPDHGSWIMDTGATSHITSNYGFNEWENDFEERQ